MPTPVSCMDWTRKIISKKHRKREKIGLTGIFKLLGRESQRRTEYQDPGKKIDVTIQVLRQRCFEALTVHIYNSLPWHRHQKIRSTKSL